MGTLRFIYLTGLCLLAVSVVVQLARFGTSSCQVIFTSGSVTAFPKNVLPIKVAGAYLRVNSSCLPDAEASHPRLRGAKDSHWVFCLLEIGPLLALLQRNFPIPCPAQFETENAVNSHSWRAIRFCCELLMCAEVARSPIKHDQDDNLPSKNPPLR